MLTGETWRPARLSGWLAVGIAVGFVLWGASGRGLGVPVAGAIAAGVVGAVGVVASGRDGHRAPFAGGLLSVVAAMGAVWALALGTLQRPIVEIELPILPPELSAAFPEGPVLTVLAFFVGLGAGLAVYNQSTDRSILSNLGLLGYVVAPLFLAVVIAGMHLVVPLPDLLSLVADVLAGTVDALVEPAEVPSLEVALYLLVFLTTVWFVLLADPLRRVRDRLPLYRRSRERVLHWVGWMGFVLVLTTAGLLAVEVGFGIERALAELPERLAAGIDAAVRSELMRLFLIGGVVACCTITVVTLLGRRVVRTGRETVVEVCSRVGAGFVVLGLVFGALTVIDAEGYVHEALESNPDNAELLLSGVPEIETVLYGTELTIFLFIVIHVGILVLVGLWWFTLLGLGLSLTGGLLPARTAGIALLAAATFVLAVVLSFVTGSTTMLFVGVVLPFVVWDLGEYAAVLGREVGRVGSTTHCELIHVGATVGTGTLAVGTALAVDALVTGMTVPGEHALFVAGLFASVVGLLALLAAATG